jgi:uncharacterized repeat protein (TIGR02543 family)
MHAQWWDNSQGPLTQYTLTFDTHGGPAAAAISAAGGTQVAKPTDPARSGFTFTGWFSAETGGTAYTWPHTLTGNVTMHARWQEGSQPTSEQCTVTFHTSGGSSAPETQTLAAGEKAVEPVLAAAVPPDAAVGLYRNVVSWYTNAAYTAVWDFNTPVTQNLDLYAKGAESSPVDLSGQSGDHTLAKALGYIAAQTLSAPTNYTVMLDTGTYDMPGVLNSEQANVKTANAVVTLLGKGPQETVLSLSSAGSLFRVTAGKLILGRNITLKGLSSNTLPLVYVTGSSASLLMQTGAKITGNIASGYGGGVYVYGSFDMEGGSISGNSVSSGDGGGGVYVGGGSFDMSGGSISGNSVSSGGDGYGGGVYVHEGSFDMSGGSISDNSADYDGGGVYVYSSGSFEMSGGTISGNSAPYGGGVYADSSDSFDMSAGSIYGNSADYSGGGVYVYSTGSFEMSGGRISGNTATYYAGGGVYVFGSDSAFVMKGGEITGNSTGREGWAEGIGGGVYAEGSFTMEAGEISGNSSRLHGGGVYAGGSFTMKGGGITGNSTFANVSNLTSVGGNGGGVYVSGSFTLESGTISGNTARNNGGIGGNGGGVSVSGNGSAFVMKGGEISGNTAANYGSGYDRGEGGGVYVGGNGSFSKTGGIVYGDDDKTNTPPENTAFTLYGEGHAVSYSKDSGNHYYRNATLTAGDNISTGDALPGNKGENLNNWTKQQ